MKKKVAIISLAIMILFLTIGIFVLVNASAYGWDAANAAIRANGGSIDTDRMYMISDAVTRSFQIIGGIILAIGDLGTLMSGCCFYKQL
ncbi:MAG: hypothetical protein E6600_04080 [Anaerocolumna aminovalerica]|jgi:hypothetical protein|uniref:hypothetical protein n=1 Tax=Anaerocolumna aminovalerica TaxID=1527 RepID=UPI0029143A9D|nr:hypothetical protein [Anaerocolumna aminovalerica]MDU6263666.1 hypothetical protein [Anaerocolumna aminovalerica]